MAFKRGEHHDFPDFRILQGLKDATLKAIDQSTGRKVSCPYEFHAYDILFRELPGYRELLEQIADKDADLKEACSTLLERIATDEDATPAINRANNLALLSLLERVVDEEPDMQNHNLQPEEWRLSWKHLVIPVDKQGVDELFSKYLANCIFEVPDPEQPRSLEDLAEATKREADTLYTAIKAELHDTGLDVTTASMLEIHGSLQAVLPDLKLQYLSQISIQADSCCLKKSNPKQNFEQKMVQLVAARHGYGRISLAKAEELCRDKK
jgi:hypothetical protein